MTEYGGNGHNSQFAWAAVTKYHRLDVGFGNVAICGLTVLEAARPGSRSGRVSVSCSLSLWLAGGPSFPG